MLRFRWRDYKLALLPRQAQLISSSSSLSATGLPGASTSSPGFVATTSTPTSISPVATSPAATPTATPAPNSSQTAGLVQSLAPVSSTTSTIVRSTSPSSVHTLSQTTIETSDPTPLQTSARASAQPVKGISDGAAAGIAVGCFIAGALIAGALVFRLYLRKRKHRTHKYDAQDVQRDNGAEKALVAASRSTEVNVARNTDVLLPMPVEDDAITKELSRIRDGIKNHVRSYYHSKAIPTTTVKKSQLSGVATATGLSASTITELFLNTSTRSEAIRLYIAWVAMSRCAGDRYPNFLPEEIARAAAVEFGKHGGDPRQYMT